jgi:hypothetical protein
MKPISFFLAIISLSACKPTTKKRHTYVDSNIMVNDTLFLRRDVKNDSVFQAVYVDPGKNPGIYDYQYTFDKQDSTNLHDFLNNLHKKHATLQKFNTYGLASTWRPVYQYKSKYYLYEPTGSDGKVTAELSDSLLMISSPDGYYPMAIAAFKQTADRIFNIQLKREMPDEYGPGIPNQVNIYIVDKKNNIAVWEYEKYGKDANVRYQLMIPKASARQYPIIVNREDYVRQAEYEGFDKLDFKKIIAGIKQK